MKNTTSATINNTTGRKPATYSKPALLRVYDKSGKLLGYSAEPEKLYEYGLLGIPKTNYQITCDEVTGIWNCTCPSVKPCKHTRAAQELNEIRLGVKLVEEVAPTAQENVSNLLLHEKLYNMTADQLEVALSAMKLAEIKAHAKDRRVKSQKSKAAYVTALLEDYAESHAFDAHVEELEAKLAEKKAAVVVPQMSADSAKDVEIVTEECHKSALINEDLSAFDVEAHQEAMHASAPDDVVSGELEDDPFAGQPEVAEEEEFSEEVAEQWVEEELTRGQATALVMSCINQIASVCDGAKDDDGVGFNGTDARWGKWMAKRGEIKAGEIVEAAYRMKKYNNTQLGGKLNVSAIERAFKVTSTTPQAPKVDYSQKGALTTNQGFRFMR